MEEGGGTPSQPRLPPALMADPQTSSRSSVKSRTFTNGNGSRPSTTPLVLPRLAPRDCDRTTSATRPRAILPPEISARYPIPQIVSSDFSNVGEDCVPKRADDKRKSISNGQEACVTKTNDRGSYLPGRKVVLVS